MRVGIAYDLRPTDTPAVDDLYEEYDTLATVQAIAEAIERHGYDVRLLGGGRELLRALLDDAPDLVFNIAEGRGSRSREAHVPAVCELLGIPCTHSDPTTLCLTLDKGLAKAVLRDAGVPTPAGVVITSPGPVDLRYPLFAKPLGEGSSMGITEASRVTSEDELRAVTARLLRDYAQPVLVEEFCDGPELTVGVLGTGSRTTALGVMEIAPRAGAPEEFVYSVGVKRRSDEAVTYTAPPDRPADLVAEVAAVGVAAHVALGCRDLSRVDVRLDATGRPRVLEVNPLPGLKPGWSDVVILAEQVGVSHADLVGLVLDEALRRR